MKSWIQVMNRMITIVPAILIVYVIDAVVYTAEMSFRITFIDKRMLCPVAHHADQPGVNDRYDKYHQGCFETDKAHGHTKCIKKKVLRW